MSVAVASWHCPPCHTTARRPARRIFHFWKVQWNGGTPWSPNCLSLSMKYCLQDTAWHSFSQIFWQFEQISRKWFWFLAPLGHLWRRIRSAACAMSLKYPCLPETYAVCFPGCGNSSHFQSTKSPFSLHTHHPNAALGWSERKHHCELLCCYLFVRRGCLCTLHVILCVFLRRIVIAVTSQWHKRGVASQGGACTGTWEPNLPLSAEPGGSVSVLQHTFTGALGQGCAWGDARAAFVWAFTAGLSSSISIWVRAHGAAPAGVGEVTLWGHTWTWPL